MNFEYMNMNEAHDDGEILTDEFQSRSQQAARKGGRKHEDLQQRYGGLESVRADQVTTLMIRNLPRRYTEEALLYELEAFISPDSYNFLYLPWDSRRSSNVGYAFVNFCEAKTARSLIDNLDGKPWRLVQSPKDIKIMPAHVQGIALNLVHYMGSMVIEDGHAHSPMVIHNGQRIDFQKAVEIYCPPELIRRHSKDVDAKKPDSSAPMKQVISPFPTQSTTCDYLSHEHDVMDSERFGYQADRSVKSELSVMTDSFAFPSQGYCSQNSSASIGGYAGKYGSQYVPGGAWSPELAKLLSSEQYVTAWKQLNGQLETLLATYKDQRGPRQRPLLQ